MAVLADFRDSQKKAERAEPASSKFETQSYHPEYHRRDAVDATWSLVAFHAGREALRGDRDMYDRDGPTR